jgi:hypothetical protein
MSFRIDELSAAISNLQTSLQATMIRMSYPGIVNIEDAKTVKVGQTYFVNVATTHKNSAAQGASFPILGDAHDDADFIAVFPDNMLHLHLDWRFIPENLYAPVVKMFVEFYGQSASPELLFDPSTKNLQLACVIPGSAVVSTQRWPLPCFRQQLRWETYPDWMPNLEAAYKDKKVCDNVCPHRGISLTGAPEDENGNRVCPGHGLMWNKEGCLVPRTRK